jgi:hypothetical protein
VKRILPDCLCLPNKLGAFWLFGFLISHSSPDLCWTFARLFDFVIFGGGSCPPPCPPGPYAYGQNHGWILWRGASLISFYTYLEIFCTPPHPEKSSAPWERLNDRSVKIMCCLGSSLQACAIFFCLEKSKQLIIASHLCVKYPWISHATFRKKLCSNVVDESYNHRIVGLFNEKPSYSCKNFKRM